mmetsp:Transcript_14636/g.55332  ORF Transcript_14636/g.55332 Transcript_14636/m.55332 type:complete len:225 (-) Transcript_14636:988-1662(-)
MDERVDRAEVLEQVREFLLRDGRDLAPGERDPQRVDGWDRDDRCGHLQRSMRPLALRRWRPGPTLLPVQIRMIYVRLDRGTIRKGARVAHTTCGIPAAIAPHALPAVSAEDRRREPGYVRCAVEGATLLVAILRVRLRRSMRVHELRVPRTLCVSFVIGHEGCLRRVVVGEHRAPARVQQLARTIHINHARLLFQREGRRRHVSRTHRPLVRRRTVLKLSSPIH